MPETRILTDSRYKKLLTDLRKVIEGGRRQAREAAGRILVETYWHLGQRIAREKLQENANYGDSLMEDLAEDLGMDVDTLRKSVLFFDRYNKKSPRALNLNWAHYRALLALTDEEARDFYEKEAARQGWTRDQLLSAIERETFEAKESGKEKTAKKLTRPTEPTYVYKAVVERIVDADTLLLRIDLGFLVWKEQRIRLAGIDCPPIDTAKGCEAFEFVRDQLARVPFVMVKTHQIDIYGRYVAHVFYSFTEKDKNKIFEEGRYLNQELLDKGLARLI